MSDLLKKLNESSPNVKLGVAVAAGVAVGVTATIAVQAYGKRKERQGALALQAPQRNVIPLAMFRSANANQ